MKVLVIESSATVRLMLGDFYKNVGFVVHEAKGSLEAISLFQENEYDLVTINFLLDEKSGLEVTSTLRTIEIEKGMNKLVPILMIAQSNSIENRVRAFELGVNEFITKPFTFQELNDKTQEALKPENLFEGSNILVAEDSEVTRKLIVRIIRSRGGNAIEAENGVRALEYFKNNLQDINLVITDLFMPEMDGLELCKTLRFGMGFKSLPIIFLTGSSETDYIVKVFEMGANDYITKPFVKEELVARLSSHLSKFRLLKNLNKNIAELKKLNNLKDDFLRVCTHDLKTPIHSILGFAELAESDPGISAVSKNYLKHIEIAGNFLNTLVEDILDITNTHIEEEKDIQEISLFEVIEDELSFFRVISDTKKIELEFDFTTESKIKIPGNKMYFQRILQNLLSNSFKFTNYGGEISIRLYLQDSFLMLEVSDNGVGIAPRNLSYLLSGEKIITTKGTLGEKGSGLGIAIAKRLVEKLQGKFELESEENKGTTFRLSFPKKIL